MNVILLDPAEVTRAGEATLTDGRAVHIISVLKAAPGQSLRIGVIDGPFGTATVISTAGANVFLQCAFDLETPPRPPVDLLLALPRPKVLRRLWAQLAAIGVGRIILTNADRVERDYFAAHVLNEEVYRPLLIEGLQQARDTRVPKVSVHRRFRALVEDDLDGLSDARARIVADPASATRIAEAVTGRSDERVLVAIGPEGGWNAFELELLQTRGFVPVGLGPRTLRTDTACVTVLSLIHATLQE